MSDMPESARNHRSTCLNPCRGSHPCDENEAGQGPNCFRSLTGRYDCDDPTDEDWRAAVEIFAELKIEICEPVLRGPTERRNGSRQKNFPTCPQNQAGNKVTPGKKRHRSDTEDDPRRSHAERMERERIRCAWSGVSPWIGKMRSRSPDHDDVCQRPKTTIASFKKFFEFRSITLSPRPRIQAREQPGELGFIRPPIVSIRIWRTAPVSLVSREEHSDLRQ